MNLIKVCDAERRLPLVLCMSKGTREALWIAAASPIRVHVKHNLLACLHDLLHFRLRLGVNDRPIHNFTDLREWNAPPSCAEVDGHKGTHNRRADNHSHGAAVLVSRL